jgi:hypothetical protein
MIFEYGALTLMYLATETEDEIEPWMMQEVSFVPSAVILLLQQ